MGRKEAKVVKKKKHRNRKNNFKKKNRVRERYRKE